MLNRFAYTLYFVIMFTSVSVFAQTGTQIKPFVLAAQAEGNFEQVIETTQSKLTAAGFEILGSYTPYAGANIIVITNAELKNIATRSERGGYGGALRVAITNDDKGVQVSYTNPVYWANAYRLSNNLLKLRDGLASALGAQQQFGSGDKVLTESDMREYHYTVMMEYFDDPSLLAYHEDHDSAVAAVEKQLEAGIAGTSKVFRLNLGKDPEGKQMTLFGVALSGKNAEDCSGDAYIMNRIDKSNPRHTAHLPYELLVYGSNVEALYARFRIAISWPHLPMLSSDTGATFLSIMCAPGAIEDALVQAAAGEIAEAVKTEK